MPTATPFNNLITFSRGSNATLTGSNGLIQWAPNNLLTFSEQFDNAAWTKSNVTVTANNAAAPDGTTTAELVTPTAADCNIRQSFTPAGAVQYTFSVWLRSATGSDISTSIRAWRDSPFQSAGIATITVTPTWQRFTLTFTALDATSHFVVVGAGSTLSTGENLFIWGAQLELGSTATTYNPTTVKNLISFSEAFDNAAWNKVSSSIVTGAQANPVNGLFNAQKLMEGTDAAGKQVTQGVATTANPFTFSSYVKAAGRNWAVLAITDSGSVVRRGFFNLATGAVGTTDAGITASITSVGSGWYRCAITIAASLAGTTTCRIYLSNDGVNTSYTGDGNSGVYIYGAQLSDSASLDAYVTTPGAAPSSTAFYGPRFDYDPVTLAPKGLLVEEARTNLATYSAQFDNAIWVKTNASVTPDATTAPDGANTADTIVENALSLPHFVSQNASLSTGLTYTATVYLKSKERSIAYLGIDNGVAGTENAYVFFNTGTGSVGTSSSVGGWTVSSSSITSVGNGWYRCSVSATVDSTVTGRIVCGPTTADGTFSYAGNGTSGIFIWGAQLEAGAFATSYIPTVASTVTRSADVATITGQNFAQWYGQPEGSFVASVGLLASFNFPVPFMAADSAAATTKRIQIYLSGTAPTYRVTDGTDQAAINTAAVAIPSTSNFATAYQANNFAATVNGAAVATDSSGTVPAVNTFYIGNQASTQFLNGHIRNIRFIPARAADFQLQALST